YRHRDLLEQLRRAQATEPAAPGTNPVVSRDSLHADLANAHERNNRLRARVHQLERRLAQAMGEQVWRESGLGAAVDIDTLQRQVAMLEQKVVELNNVMDERNRELTAARAANRELMVRLNA